MHIRMPRFNLGLVLLIFVAAIQRAWCFGVVFDGHMYRATISSRLFPHAAAPSDDSSESNGDDEEVIAESVVRIDDGGSDLTDRFKWKVNALMGVFDPAGEDDERQDGNIMNAILNFPVKYSFNVVGRTGGDDALVDKFVAQVKEVIVKTTGDEDDIQTQITPRSKNFTKVRIQANVANAAMISAAYDDLESLELTVMRF